MAKRNAQPITGLAEGDVAPYIFLCGDPDRVPRISARWTGVREVCRLREYVVHTGTVDGIEMTAASTGIGAPSSAILVEELAKLGARVLLRVGNSGALGDAVGLGDFVITTAAIRDEGTSRSYVAAEFPAVAHFEVVTALVDAARSSGHPFHAGITWSIDAFYARNKVVVGDGLGSMSMNGFEQSGMNERVRDWKRAGALNVEMESSAILTLAALFGLRGGCICTVSDRTPWPGPGQDALTLDRNMAGMIDVAHRAMRALATP